jgi:hypothetical protein
VSGKNYYLLSLLPAPEALGLEPPISCAAFLELLNGDKRTSARRLVETILLSDDLLQRDAYLAGEIETPTPAVLTPQQARDELPLPDDLAEAVAAAQTPIPNDAVWEAYFRRAAVAAEQLESKFLRAWVGFEVALRNTLADARARALEMDSSGYLLAEDLAATDEDFTAVLSEWTAAPNPLAGQRALDAARWDWIGRHDGYFSFGDDELGAYAAKLMLTTRWHRMQKEAKPQSTSASP